MKGNFHNKIALCIYHGSNTKYGSMFDNFVINIFQIGKQYLYNFTDWIELNWIKCSICHNCVSYDIIDSIQL